MFTVTAYAPRRSTLRSMAEEIRKQRIAQINDESKELVHYPPLGQC